MQVKGRWCFLFSRIFICLLLLFPSSHVFLKCFFLLLLSIIGRAAFTGSHQWILLNKFTKDAYPPEVWSLLSASSGDIRMLFCEECMNCFFCLVWLLWLSKYGGRAKILKICALSMLNKFLIGALTLIVVSVAVFETIFFEK